MTGKVIAGNPNRSKVVGECVCNILIIRQSNTIRVSNSSDTTLLTQTFVDKAVKGTQVIGVDYTVFTARCYAFAVLAMGLCLSVCPSVRLSVTSQSSTKTAKRRITQSTPHDTPKDSSLLMPKISAKFDRGHPLRGRRMQVGWVRIGDL